MGSCYGNNMIKVDRNALSVRDLHASSDDEYWHARPAVERLRAVQINRQVAYGRTRPTRGLQRILEVAERERG